MLRGCHLRPSIGMAGILGLIAVAAWVLVGGDAKWADFEEASHRVLRRPAGYAQLVSVEPLPAMDGEMCQWMPAGANATLLASLRQNRSTSAAQTLQESRTTLDADRSPLRILRDTYPTYSAVAVDVVTDEVYLQDENLFGYRVFNRLDNTPPTARFTEPKRVVGGIHTKMGYNCALYIDPKTGDIYSVNNDMLDTMVVFPREAEGNVAPKRELHTPHRTWGIAVDEENQELFLTVQHPPQVVVYRKTASGEERPIRVIEGGRTQLEDAHGIAVDTKNQWIFVSNHGNTSNFEVAGSGKFEPPSITVYPLKASGDIPPLRVIEGPRTQLNWPAALYLDQERGELYVANDTDNSILVFRVTDSGDAAPARVVKGARTGIANPTGVFVDLKNDELWVSNMGNHSATVYPRTANGDIAPLRTIRSAPKGKVAMAIGNPGGVAYDSKRDEILVPN